MERGEFDEKQTGNAHGILIYNNVNKINKIIHNIAGILKDITNINYRELSRPILNQKHTASRPLFL